MVHENVVQKELILVMKATVLHSLSCLALFNLDHRFFRNRYLGFASIHGSAGSFVVREIL
jgi:hypothetical protein